MTVDLINAFKEDMRYIEANPDTAFTGAMCALKNLRLFRQHMATSKPWIGFRTPHSQVVLMVIEGSKKHKNCVRKKMVRADPYTKEREKEEARLRALERQKKIAKRDEKA